MSGRYSRPEICPADPRLTIISYEIARKPTRNFFLSQSPQLVRVGLQETNIFRPKPLYSIHHSKIQSPQLVRVGLQETNNFRPKPLYSIHHSKIQSPQLVRVGLQETNNFRPKPLYSIHHSKIHLVAFEMKKMSIFKLRHEILLLPTSRRGLLSQTVTTTHTSKHWYWVIHVQLHFSIPVLYD